MSYARHFWNVQAVFSETCLFYMGIKLQYISNLILVFMSRHNFTLLMEWHYWNGTLQN